MSAPTSGPTTTADRGEPTSRGAPAAPTRSPQLMLTVSESPNPVGVCPQATRRGCAGYPAGSSLEYSVTVGNNSGVTRPGTVIVTGELPPYLDAVAGRTSARADCARRGQEVSCDVGPVPPGTTIVVTVLATVITRPPDDKLTATFSARAGDGARTPISEIVTVSTLVGTDTGHGA